MSAKPLLLIQTGTPPEDILNCQGDLPDWFIQALEGLSYQLQIVRVFEGESLPAPDAVRAAIITGSWSMVSERLAWSESTAHWIRQAMDVSLPLFGVCYGHQLMAHALGGVVEYHPAGLEIGCQMVELLPEAIDDVWMEGLPPHFYAHLTHFQTVLTLPPGAQVFARTNHDPHQILRYGPHALSTQFHPEFTPDISVACINRRADMLSSQGLNPQSLIDDLQETPIARSLLRRFVETYSS